MKLEYIVVYEIISEKFDKFVYRLSDAQYYLILTPYLIQSRDIELIIQKNYPLPAFKITQAFINCIYDS